jgi:hypothetical protein
MTTVLCHCRVADYDAWRPGYDHAVRVTPHPTPSRGAGAPGPGRGATIEQISTRHERHVRGKAESFHRYLLGEIDGTLAQRPLLSLL